jgi:hypothetical protein
LHGVSTVSACPATSSNRNQRATGIPNAKIGIVGMSRRKGSSNLPVCAGPALTQIFADVCMVWSVLETRFGVKDDPMAQEGEERMTVVVLDLRTHLESLPHAYQLFFGLRLVRS